jgi:hypothetical protein
MKGEDVDFSVAKALFQALSGFRGYPKPGPGQDHFVEAFQSSVVSVAHARAVIASFDGVMPTVREIRDSAFNLRPQFETTVDQRKEWEAKYGPPDTAFSRRIRQMAGTATDKPAPADPETIRRQYAEEKRCMLWQAIRDSLYYTEGPGGRGPDQFWGAAAEKHKRNHPAEVAAFRAQLAESGWDVLMQVDWLKSMPVSPVRRAVSQKPVAVLERPITAEDVNRELRVQGREPGDDE